MKRRTRLVGVVAAAASVAALIPLTAAPAAAVSEPEVVAEGLNNPYKMSFGPDGTLYVAEAGVGPVGDEGAECVELPETPDGEGGGDVCIGATGSVTAVDPEGGQARVVTGLPSIAPHDADGNGAVGPVDVAVVDGVAHVIVGLGGDPELRSMLGEAGAGLGTIIQVPLGEGEASILADLVQFEADEDPDADQPGSEGVDSNPFAIEISQDGGFWAVDAGGNDVLSISAEGDITVEAVLPSMMAAAPPFLGLPPGTQLPYQSVPTSITSGTAGLLVTELTGFPFPVGASDLFDLSSGELQVLESGFSAVVDAAQAPDGTIYVLEFAAQGLLAAETGGGMPTSRLTQIRTDGTRKVLLEDELFLSNGVAVDEAGMVYVSNGSQVAGGGTVIKVDPTVPGDPAAAAACQPTDVPGAGYGDVGGNVHREAIDCLAWWGVIEGRSATDFAPRMPVRRDQLASIVLRLLQLGTDLPEAVPDAFTDDGGNVHEESINQLAAAGVLEGVDDDTFNPSAPVTRAQVASILARAWTLVIDELPAGSDLFTDDDGSVHEAAVNAVAGAGWVNGRSEGIFDPNGEATRDQLSSMVARMLADLVDEGFAEAPAVG